MYSINSFHLTCMGYILTEANSRPAEVAVDWPPIARGQLSRFLEEKISVEAEALKKLVQKTSFETHRT